VLPLAEREADVVVMAAAVADFRPAVRAARKLKKAELGKDPQPPAVVLEPTLDILAELGRRRGAGRQPLLIGFAAETHDVEGYARRKLRDKRCDVIVANDVAEPGSGFGTDTNRVTLIFAGKSKTPPRIERLPQLPKDEVAARIWTLVAPLLPKRSS
jgi:phosphopantothenoylcysteine decarboxylase/phosphopantothenate--cysteine ligase